MPILPLVIAPDVRLLEVAEPLPHFDAATRQFVADMFDSLDAYKGAGLAATQVGVMKRVFVMDLPEHMDETAPRLSFVNPEIVYNSEETWVAEEGCLSLPAIDLVAVTRPQVVTVKYICGEDGIEKELTASGWSARCIQHEIDHLNGITLLNYLPKLKRDIALKKLIKYKKWMAERGGHHGHHHHHDGCCG